MCIICDKFKKLEFMTIEEIKNARTRQLLGELKRTYKDYGCFYCWKDSDWERLREYKEQLKQELATREHIPNKIESKKLRKARIKKGK